MKVRMRYIIDGEIVDRDVYTKRTAPKRKKLGNAGAGRINRAYSRPFACVGAGVHPEQIPEAMAVDAQHGVPTQYTPGGDPIITSRSHFNRYLKAHGLFNRAAGYGDRTKS
jgi:hypothetical protein